MAHFNQRYTVEQVAEALMKAGGVLTWAGELLGCNGSTIKRYLEQYPELEAVRDEAREVVLDIAEHQLIRKVKRGNMAAVTFLLKCQGKSRGYIERGELKIANTSPVVLMLPPEEGDAPKVGGGNGRAQAERLLASAPIVELDAEAEVDEQPSDEQARAEGWRGGAPEPVGEDRRTPDEIDDDGGPY